MSIGEYIRSARKELGFSIRELSRVSGISHPYLSQIETGKNNNPSLDTLKKLSDALGNVTYSGLLDAAGFKDLAESEKIRSLYEDFSDELLDTAKLYERVQVLEQTKDIKNFLELNFKDVLAESVYPHYNGHKLTEEDRKRILNVLKELFPEYQKKGSDLNDG